MHSPVQPPSAEHRPTFALSASVAMSMRAFACYYAPASHTGHATDKQRVKVRTRRRKLQSAGLPRGVAAERAGQACRPPMAPCELRTWMHLRVSGSTWECAEMGLGRAKLRRGYRLPLFEKLQQKGVDARFVGSQVHRFLPPRGFAGRTRLHTHARVPVRKHEQETRARARTRARAHT